MMSDCSEVLGQSIKTCSSGSAGTTEQHPIKLWLHTNPKSCETQMNLSRILHRTQVKVDIQPKEHKKCPRQFYLRLCFQMRVTAETFIKDPSPSAQCAWQMSFSGDTLRAGKHTPVMQLWIKTDLGGHLRTHTKYVWGSQTFLSKASWMSKTLIECILSNALVLIFGTPPFKPVKDLPAVPRAPWALTQLSFTHSSDSRHPHSGAKLHSSRSCSLLFSSTLVPHSNA